MSLTASGCTAWATHMIALLAFQPGMPSAFEPLPTALSLLAGVTGVGAGVAIALRGRSLTWRFVAGVVLGCGVAALHYLGQAAYVVTGEVRWDLGLVAWSIPLSLLISGAAIMATGMRERGVRQLAAPLLLLSIAVLHFAGMTAATLVFDPRRTLPSDAVPAAVLAPVVASVCLGLLVLAVMGLKFTREAQARARRDRARLKELASVALEGLAICDGEVIAIANASLESLSGLQSCALVGRRMADLLPQLDLRTLPELEERDAELVAAGDLRIPVRVLRRRVPLGDQAREVVAIRDQRERLRTEARMRDLAFNDTLTGLANRGRFHDLLTVRLASRRAQDLDCAVLMIDLDRFKSVNDTLGHSAGDALLCAVADRLRTVVRDGDVIARLGGDEFAVLQAEAAGPEAPGALAGRIVDLLGRPFLIEDQAVHIGASVGVARAPDDGVEPAELLHNADMALYAAKAEGRGGYRLFDPELDLKVQARRQMELGLRRALSEGQLELHYQPLVETRTGRVTSAEALVRWRHPERGLIPPADFISLAEETGLIVPLGEWVLRTACQAAAGWPDAISVAVNLSPVQFRDARLAATVRSALEASGVPPTRLELEITEGVLIVDEQRTLATLTELRAAGVRISMDDFGTGYSSLSYLRRFPFDKIKVDQSFVRQLPHDPESAAIVRAILTMGSCLGMSTTVEGVETAEQFAFTAAEGCDHVQGYLFSRPLPLCEFQRFLQTRVQIRNEASLVETLA